MGPHHLLRRLPLALAAAALALAPGAAPEIRDRARAALQAMGHPADARAETLSPAEWRDLCERLC